MYPHRIRLAGPWEAEPILGPGAGGQPPARRVTLPCRLSEIAPLTPGAVLFRRRFGLPRRIDEWERVWLTCAKVIGQASWRLNSMEVEMRPTPAGGPEAEVTSLLQDRNEVAVRLEGVGPESGLYGEVALEVRCRAYLRGVRASAHPAEAGWVVRVVGAVISERSADPLELYLLIDNRVQDYQKLQGDQWETPFNLAAPVEFSRAGDRVTVRVDLVNGATIWHTVETVIELG
jgi:hypothetical protein